MNIKNLFFVVGVSIMFVSPVSARPYADTVGICYLFKQNNLIKQEPCIINTGYGAGGHYIVLNWSNQQKNILSSINYCPNNNYDSQGFCEYLVDEKEAITYMRDVFYYPTDNEDEENIYCYQIKNQEESICYRIPL